ncbi:MAG: leucine-rich repeat domain-containing protein [Bacteroidales bacterium]|nr:leucine-rich repeat domain-containing protein [Bacteroidales bacterium]
MKKQVFLTILLVLASVANAFEVRTPSGDTVSCYTVYNTTNEVSVEKTWGKQYTGHLTIPSTVTYNGTTYTVTRISDNGFSSCAGLSSISLPSSLTHIGNNAFNGCTGLTNISLVPPLQFIGSNAFQGCTGLTSVTIPPTVSSLGGYSFKDCTNLTTVNLNADSLYLGYWTWGNYPFDSNYVTTVNIGNNVKRLPNYIFCGCSRMTTLSLGNSLRRIDNGAFYGCRGLLSVTIPDATTFIGSSAFYGCSNLAQLSLGQSVDTILEQAFSWCAIASLTIPRSMKYISSRAFSDNTNLTILTFNADSCRFSSNYYTFDTNISSLTIGPDVRYIPQCFVAGCNQITEIVLPDAVRYVDGEAFRDCHGLNELTIGRGLTYIGLWGFSNCESLAILHYNADSLSDNSSLFGTALRTITFGPYVRVIPSQLCINCSGLTGELVLPGTVTRIGNSAFLDCDGITSITIPASVRSIGSFAFYGIDSLSAVVFNAANCTVMSTESPFRLNWDESGKPLTVTFGQSVVRVPDHLFYGCGQLVDVVFGGAVADIGEEAFRGCGSLHNLTLGSSVRVVGRDAFNSCDSVTTLSLPASLDSIADGAFWNMYRLQRVDYAGTADQWCRITFGSNPVYYSHNLYLGGHLLTDLRLASNTTQINPSAFERCNSLRSVNTGASCTVIGANAFYFCDSLRTVVIGSSVDSIASCAFGACNSIDSMACRSLQPPVLGNGAVNYYSYYVSLHVPCGAAEAYEASEWHNHFNNIVEGNAHMISAYAAEPWRGTAEVTQTPTCSNPTAVITATPTNGNYFDHWQDGGTANPRTVTVSSDATYVAYFVDIVGIEKPDSVHDMRVSVAGLQLIVDGLQGGFLTVCDALGRTVYVTNDASDTQVVNLPSAGVYIVRSACCGTQRIVAVR